MIINSDRQFIFIHIPKVAGTSISKSLGGEPGMFLAQNVLGEQQLISSHTYASEVKRFMGSEQYNAFFKFAFVRNPWDRLYSLYNFMVNSEEINRGKHIFDQEEAHRRGFKWFLLENRTKYTRVKLYGVDVTICQQITPQLDWLTQDNRLIVDYVGTYENLQQDFSLISERIGITEPLRWHNKFSSRNYVHAYDNEMIDFVTHYHEKDIQMFHYTFDGPLTNRM